MCETAAGHISESYLRVQNGVMEYGTVLASYPPWEVQAQVVAEVYRSGLRAREPIPSVNQIHRIRVLRGSKGFYRLVGGGPMDAIRPNLNRWVKRRLGVLTFRLTKVLTIK